MTGLKWTRRSTYTLSEALAAEDLAACPNTVASLLKENGFSLKRNRKEIGETLIFQQAMGNVYANRVSIFIYSWKYIILTCVIPDWETAWSDLLRGSIGVFGFPVAGLYDPK